MTPEEIISKSLNLIQTLFQLLYWYMEALYKQVIPPPKQSINGETILVTGAAGGIGREICKNLLHSGSNIKLVLWDVHKPSLEKLKVDLEAIGEGNKIYCFEVDISTRENIELASQEVIKCVGPITIIFNNAGIGFHGNILLQSHLEIEKTIQVNLMSHIWIIRQFLPDMVVKNHGRIINTCSLAGLKSMPRSLPYSASKFAVNGYSESLKMELEEFGHDGIHVSTVFPYFTKTPIIKSLEFKSKDKIRNFFNVFMEPARVGKAIVDGMMRGNEYIYVPRTIPLGIVFMEYLLPTKARKVLYGSFFPNFVYADETEKERATMSFNEVISTGKFNGYLNGNVTK